jgi:hypothetical protein
MTSPSESRGGLPPRIAVVFAVVSFLALVICGLGVTSLILDADVISTPENSSIPGIVGVIAAMAAFSVALLLALRAQHPSFWSAPIVAVAAYLFYGGGVMVGALFAGVAPAAAVAAGGRSFVSWFGVVVAISGLVCAWGGIALVRTRAGRPRWGWERDDDE